jgi:DNA invertase Pin-like site-specific DNA recombinase
MSQSRIALYCRTGRRSTDPGSAAVIDRQEAACRELAQSLGWEPMAVYTDTGMSTFGERQRPGYERLLTAIKADEIGGVIAYELTTLTRLTQEMDDLLDLLTEHDIVLRTVSNDVDLSAPAGRYAARVMTAMAEHESATQDAHRQRREQV